MQKNVINNVKNFYNKFQDWIDITYYKITHLSIKRFWINIKRWISYYPVIRKTYDFDYTSQLEIELHQLTKLRDCISKYQSHVNFWYDLRNMNWAIECLKIVIEDGCSYSNGEPIFFEKQLEDGSTQLIPNYKRRYIMPIYVNTKNSKRFLSGYTDNSITITLFKDQLRIEKAWYLYNKIKLKHLRSWWD